MTQINSISAEHLAERRAVESIELIDVRSPAEFREVHADIARNVPLSSLDPKAVLADRKGAVDTPVYVICKSGSRGSKACQKFVACGFSNVVNVVGGTDAWIATGLPVERGKRMMSIERQVRIAAGSIVLTGALLSFFVHPYFIAIPAFVGAGLTIAGITDTCGMGLLIARMPWNQLPETNLKCEIDN